MSSSARTSTEGSRSPTVEIPTAEPATAAAVDPGLRENPQATAVPTVVPTAAILDGPLAPAKQAPPEKAKNRRGSRKARQQRRKQSKAQSPAARGLSSASSFSPTASPGPALSHGAQVTTPDLPTAATSPSASSPAARWDEKKREVQQDPSASAGQPREVAAHDPLGLMHDARALPGVRATVVQTHPSTSPPPNRSVRQQRSPSPKFDVLKALASLTPSPDKDLARKESTRGFKLLLAGSAEPLSTTDRSAPSAVPARGTLSFDAKVMVFFLAVVAILTLLYLYRYPKQHAEAYCTTKCCDEHRYRISIQLDKNVDPCDDFAAHVCGGWRPRKELSLSRSEMSEMYTSWQHKFQNILEKGSAHFPIAKKVVAMFQSCLRQNDSQVSLMKKFMRERGIVWPEAEDTDTPPAKALFDLSFNWNVHLWFSLKILPAVVNEKPRRVFFQSNQLMQLWKAMLTAIPKEYLDRVYIDLFKIFSMKTGAQPSAEGMANTYRMLNFVFSLLVPSCPCQARVPELFALSSMNSLTEPLGTHVANVLNEVTRIDPPFTLDDVVLVNDMNQFRYIMYVINSLKDEAVLRHLSWLFVQAYGAVAYPTAVLLVISGSEHRAKESRPRYCATQVESSYKLLVAAMASVGLFSEDERRRVTDYMARIVQAAVEKTMVSSWLDNGTSQVAVEKFRSVRTVLWPSEKFLKPETLEKVYENFSDSSPSFTQFWIDTRRSHRQLYGSEAAEEELRLGDNTQLPYMDYNQVISQLSVSLGALAHPLYCRDGSIGMIYGGLLYYYARALIGAIDREGVKIDPHGDIVGSWLNESIQDTFEKRTLHCLPGNVSIFPEIPAMEIAYAAFKRHMEENNTRLSQELTEEKVFFITACLTACSTTPADNLFGGDCNKAVMNFAPFAEAFNCRVGTKMNPASKCTFYD
ncbi:hypothetical protein HPB50_019828 [Hyalomma asiaticum]|uniref:Uncharacterized protein n=1 Tax=Hyalomma asiaticum TaxID=266040 RepID=A0ACB7S0B8_HYAAI|nr:hypothetical protein HPB50_019828 [Hyalomma asiaticum]